MYVYVLNLCVFVCFGAEVRMSNKKKEKNKKEKREQDKNKKQKALVAPAENCVQTALNNLK